ncbi:MAG: SAM-dependent methyltransferase [Alistipes sp.]
MMTMDQYQLLCTPEVQRAIRENNLRDPLEVALDKHVIHAQLVASQLKYLARAKTKLPTYAAASCILPALAFEQASSEACAGRKSCKGQAALDLTCGLGVDALLLAGRFDRVVTLERDEVLAKVAQENFARMGVRNIQVIHNSAEAYLATCTEHFDWIYADPDRRSSTGKKLLRLEDCSPNIFALMPTIQKIAGRLCLKNSPLFDVDEAFRLFPRSRVEVVSLKDECKEVVIYADDADPTLTAVALGQGEYSSSMVERTAILPKEAFCPKDYRWLIIPDVALQKARLACHHLCGKAWIESDNGYGFAVTQPEGILGRIFAIETIEAYHPKVLRKQLSGATYTILKRDFPLTTAQIAKQIGLREGGTQQLAFTQVAGQRLVIRLK